MNHEYPITGCGRPGCRTCHPYLIPDEPDGLTWKQVVGAIAGGVLAFCAVYVFLVLFITVTTTTTP